MPIMGGGFRREPPCYYHLPTIIRRAVYRKKSLSPGQEPPDLAHARIYDRILERWPDPLCREKFSGKNSGYQNSSKGDCIPGVNVKSMDTGKLPTTAGKLSGRGANIPYGR